MMDFPLTLPAIFRHAERVFPRREIVTRREGERFKLASLERYAFYARTKQCFAIVATAERRLYGNIILKKGVIRPE